MHDVLEELTPGDLGVNWTKLLDVVNEKNNSTFVDLGVWYGVSSKIMNYKAKEKNNTVYGVDISFDCLAPSLRSVDTYKKIRGDSSTVGKYWKMGMVDILFVDTFHIKEQVLCELYYWHKYLKEGSYAIFHDTNWPPEKREPYGGIPWDRPDDAVREFFNLSNLNEENEFVESKNYPDSHGMTFVKIKKMTNFLDNVKDWSSVFSKRNHLISLFWNPSNSSHLTIDLNLSQ